MSTIFMFPGQGSQEVGMGADLFDRFPEETAAADEILGYSIATLCTEDPDGNLNNTAYTQPALYVVNALSHLARVAYGETPDVCIGHSLGEYDALFAAVVFSFTDGLRLVQRRGAIMSKATGGGMAAVLMLEPEKIREVIADPKWSGIDVANYNSPRQTVISGPKALIVEAQEAFEAAGCRRYVVLAVSGAFHSRYMSDAEAEFREFLAEFTFNKPQVPVIANVTAEAYDDDVADTLARQITGSVRWTDTLAGLLKEYPEGNYVEVGPKIVLTGLLRDAKRAMG
jgi:trans-AT polyketide synthase/acyltransferase/oxidoreductase domain-containing protein